mmetsp:Transcript_34895/g.68692  ORF Transcript_34895/g.68692 Transcript_34895/m.68692 type:complete len:190 (+) Transcript_34895:2-571(+)|eukprot:CAMPEP_0194339508 /NCGR_PEP_ID=MMETSP0171-20130528/83393_1 /TAXON_ID=218684 /ORGANISM="Corethron pennatum, Strain L29A3" /LENGTH=189 /DNA_ID=CAMNT_0039104101 /DNA_START=252 /DNA_END=821 /DNA_ORIENTATION=+
MSITGHCSRFRAELSCILFVMGNLRVCVPRGETSHAFVGRYNSVVPTVLPFGGPGEEVDEQYDPSDESMIDKEMDDIDYYEDTDEDSEDEDEDGGKDGIEMEIQKDFDTMIRIWEDTRGVFFSQIEMSSLILEACDHISGMDNEVYNLHSGINAKAIHCAVNAFIVWVENALSSDDFHKSHPMVCLARN